MAKRRRTTLRTIAKALNVSPGTVSRSLREYPGAHPEMRQRVREMAESMGYVSRGEAARERAANGAGRPTKIGVVVGDAIVLSEGAVNTTYVAYHFLSGMSRAAHQLDASMSVGFVNAATLDKAAEPQRELGSRGRRGRDGCQPHHGQARPGGVVAAGPGREHPRPGYGRPPDAGGR